MSNEQIEEIELNIAEAKKIVELGNALERLSNNKDFLKLISENYFKEEACRLVHLKAAPAMQNEANQAAIEKAMDAIGGLYQFFSKIETQAEMAKNAIAASEEELEELLATGDE